MKNKYEHSTPSTSTVFVKKNSSVAAASLFGKSGYKFWVLFAILLLAFWSMFVGSVSLKWSTGHLTRFSGDFNFPVDDDLDVLEVEERKKVVRRMWDLYTHRSGFRLPRFWLEAFEAAYEYLTNDVPGVRDAAVSEIAKISLRSIKIDPFPVQFTKSRQTGKNSKVADKSQE